MERNGTLAVAMLLQARARGEAIWIPDDIVDLAQRGEYRISVSNDEAGNESGVKLELIGMTKRLSDGQS